MHQITVQRVVSAAHAIRLYDGSLETVHGHDWRIDVTVQAGELDAIDVVMDFHVLERIVDELLDRIRNRHINDVVPFAGDGPHGLAVNPTAERVAQWIGEAVGGQLPEHATLAKVCVGEAPGCIATWRPQ